MHEGTSFCSMPLVSGDRFYLVDGKNDSAWANLNSYENYFIIDFLGLNFSMDSYTIQWPCLICSKITVEGSHDNFTWNIISSQSISSSEYIQRFPCNNNRGYTYFRFTQPILTRFHVMNIEIFGVLNPTSLSITCIPDKHSILINIFIVIFSSFLS